MSIIVTDFPTIGYHRGYEIKEIPAGTDYLTEDAIALWDPISQCHVCWTKGKGGPNALDIAADQIDRSKQYHGEHTPSPVPPSTSLRYD